MIYVDTSVVLASVLAEDRTPPEALWDEPLISSRLTEYECWTRIHAKGLAASHGELIREALARVSFLELAPDVLARALDPFPVPVRTLDGLHLASCDYLRSQRIEITLAAYDARLVAAAEALDIPLFAL